MLKFILLVCAMAFTLVASSCPCCRGGHKVRAPGLCTLYNTAHPIQGDCTYTSPDLIGTPCLNSTDCVNSEMCRYIDALGISTCQDDNPGLSCQIDGDCPTDQVCVVTSGVCMNWPSVGNSDTPVSCDTGLWACQFVNIVGGFAEVTYRCVECPTTIFGVCISGCEITCSAAGGMCQR